MAKLHVLCLHGSRQSSEIFSQRIHVLMRKLQDIAELHFAEAPHELPLMEGQSVPMRAWWRHGGLVDLPEGADSDAQIVADWHASLQVLEGQWRSAGGYDVILGFSNGAAATFLLAAHVLARPADFPGRRLKCAIMAGGYVPQPLDRLLPKAIRTQASAVNGEHAPSMVLAAPLRLASLHIYSPQDKYVSMDQSKQLATQFDTVQKMEHDSGHCVPQKASQVSTIMDFLSWFEPPPKGEAHPEQQELQQPSTVPQEPVSVETLSLKEQLEMQQPSKEHAWEQEPSQPELPGSPSPETPCVPPSAEQQEEIEALQAIFEGCCVLLPSTDAVRLRVRLRDPSTLQQDNQEDVEAEEAVLQAKPSTLFALDCTLPEGYPSEGKLPSFRVSGPPIPPDQQGALSAHLDAVATENVVDMGQACIYQVVEAAKEWLDSNLPADFLKSYASRNWSSSNQHQHQTNESEAKTAPPWWENEEADSGLVARAIAEASASRDSLLPDPSRPHAAEGGSAGCMQVAEAADSMQRGRWEYCIGLVGKPSAGKSSFFNAVTQPVAEDEGARVAAYPFTTIDPQTGRGFAVVPDPCNLLGPEIASRCKPLHGFAPAFDPARASQELNNTQPLHSWAAAVVGSSDIKWRRVPIAIKDVAGLVPGAYQV